MSIPASQYPLINFRDLPGPPPYVIAVYFHEDSVRMTIETDTTLTPCQVRVGLALGPGITWQKEIWGWHSANGPGPFVAAAGGNSGPNFMVVNRGAVDTILFKKAKALGTMTGMYALATDMFWPCLADKTFKMPNPNYYLP